MPTVPLFGTATKGKSPLISSQRRVNVTAEVYQGQAIDKAPYNLLARPGLSLYGAITGAGGNPVRGFSEQVLLVQGGQQSTNGFMFVSGSGWGFGGPTVAAPFQGFSGFLATTGGSVSIATNPTQMLIADGVQGTLVSLVSPYSFISYPGGGFPTQSPSVCFIAGRFVAADPTNNGRFYWSANDDGTSWDALDFANAETAPDPLYAVKELNGTLLLLGRDTTEFWAPSGDTAVFRRITGSGLDWGIVAPFSAAKAKGGLVMLGRQRAGADAQVIFIWNYNAIELSDPDVTYDINNESSLETATGFAFVSGGHTFYQLNLSQRSWVYDFTTQVWTEFRSGVGPETRHIAQYAVPSGGKTYVSGWNDSNIYTLDLNTYTDNGAQFATEIISKHALADYERFGIHEIYFDMEVGDGLATGQGSAPRAMLQWSRDGGRTYGSEIWQDMGAMGQYRTRALWRNIGEARDWVIKMRVADPIRRVFTNAAMKI